MIVRPGDIIESWCSKCGHATPHVYQPDEFCKLRCLTCPEQEKKQEEKKGRVR